MNDRRWPSFAEIKAMESTEAYDLYWNLPAPADAAQLEVIRALGDQAWKMRQEEDGVRAKRTFLPMPGKSPAEPVILSSKRPKFKPAAKASEEARGGAQFFLSGLKR